MSREGRTKACVAAWLPLSFWGQQIPDGVGGSSPPVVGSATAVPWHTGLLEIKWHTLMFSSATPSGLYMWRSLSFTARFQPCAWHTVGTEEYLSN